LWHPHGHILEVLCCIKKHKADLNQNINVLSYNTRINQDIHVQFCRITSFKKSVVQYSTDTKQTYKVKRISWKVYSIKEWKLLWSPCLHYNKVTQTFKKCPFIQYSVIKLVILMTFWHNSISNLNEKELQQCMLHITILAH
jgi:hypothetical protein